MKNYSCPIVGRDGTTKGFIRAYEQLYGAIHEPTHICRFDQVDCDEDHPCDGCWTMIYAPLAGVKPPPCQDEGD